MESLILLLFEKHKEFGPNILQYIHNSLLCNIPLLESFNILLNTSTIKKSNIPKDPVFELQVWARLDCALVWITLKKKLLSLKKPYKVEDSLRKAIVARF